MSRHPRHPRHTRWFFLFWLGPQKDHPWRRETVKGALMVMYSCVASHCHPQMLLAHVDNPITAKIIHHYSSSCQVAPGGRTPHAEPGWQTATCLVIRAPHPRPVGGQESHPTPSFGEAPGLKLGILPCSGEASGGHPLPHPPQCQVGECGSQKSQDRWPLFPASLTPSASPLPPPLLASDPSLFIMDKKWGFQEGRGSRYFLGMAGRGKHRRKQKLFYYCF